MISLFFGTTWGVAEGILRPGPVSLTLTQAAQVLGAFTSSLGASYMQSGYRTPVWFLRTLQILDLPSATASFLPALLVLSFPNGEFSGSKVPSDPDMNETLALGLHFLLSGHGPSLPPPAARLA